MAPVVLVMLFGTIFLATCKNPADQKADATATVVGCDKVKYKGVTYTISCDHPGLASFDVKATQIYKKKGKSAASFHITCSGGCISEAVPF
jgi:hypothetical protein